VLLAALDQALALAFREDRDKLAIARSLLEDGPEVKAMTPSRPPKIGDLVRAMVPSRGLRPSAEERAKLRDQLDRLEDVLDALLVAAGALP
jgi:hypothetical protein